MNLNDLKNEIISIPPDEPALIYIGVGGAASVNNNNILQPEHYQQFPPFLQNIRNKVPNINIFLLLIDPYQESPPRVAVDYGLIDQYDSQCHFRGNRLQAFVYRLSVYTDPDLNKPDGGLNITPILSNLSQFAKENHVTLIYHDFSGRRVALLAEHFDQENRDHLDQIVYGLSAREDHGCFFDLTKPNAYFPYRIEKEINTRPILKLFNYYKFIVNNTYEESEKELAKFPKIMHPLADVQKNQIINKIREQLKNTNLSILRQVYKLMLHQEIPDEKELAYQSKYLFNDLPKFFRNMFTELFKEKDYTLLYELLFNFSASELDILAKLKPMNMSGEELMTFITLDEDPYKWYNTINELL
jgi:hypothetical protein